MSSNNSSTNPSPSTARETPPTRDSDPSPSATEPAPPPPAGIGLELSPGGDEAPATPAQTGADQDRADAATKESMLHIERDEDAPVPPVQTAVEHEEMESTIKKSVLQTQREDVPMTPSQIAAGFENMDRAIKETGKDAGMVPPLPPPQMATLAEEMENYDEVYDSKKKAAPTTEADDNTPPPSLSAVLPVAQAPSPPPTDQGRSPSNPGGQQQLPIRPPPPSMMPSPDDDADPPVPALPHYPSMTPLVATLVEDQQQALVSDLPVYDAIQIPEQTWMKKYKKYIIAGLGLFFGGAAVAAGVAVSSNNSAPSTNSSQSARPSTKPTLLPSSSPSKIPSSSLQPSPLPPLPPSTYWSSLNWNRQGLGFNGDTPDDQFGVAVAFSADASTMAIGATGDWDDKDRPGYVKVYRREGKGSSWEQRGETIRGKANGDNFGISLSLSEDGTALSVGAPHDISGPDLGQVKVYEWDEATSDYAQIGDTLYGTASGDGFGSSLDISSSKILAVGADRSNANGSDSGQVTIYAWDDVSSNFKRRGEAINGDAAGDLFGFSVSLAGNGQKLAVGAPYNYSNGSNSGQVRVFEWDETTSNYVQLGDSLLGDAADDQFGESVSLSRDGTALAIGAPFNGENGQWSGQVKVFAWHEAASNFEQIGQSLYGKAADDQFGTSVALSSEGETLAVGAPQYLRPGYVEVYGWDEAASEYKRLGQSLGGEASDDLFGFALALAGNGRGLAIGAPWNDRNGTQSGRVEVFDIEL